MVKIVDKQNVFNKGIMTSKLRARDDLQQYTQGVAEAKNFVLSKYGPLTKRVGTKFIADLENVGKESALIPFTFSVDKSILLEFTSNKIRFYTFDGENFGQSRIYKLVADDLEETAEHKYIYITDDPIKSWASQDDKEKATKVFADSSCSELIGYIRSDLTTCNIDIAIEADGSYYDYTVLINNTDKLIQFISNDRWTKTTFKTIPAKVNHSVFVENKDILLLFCDNDKEYVVQLPTTLDAQENGNITITEKTSTSTNKIPATKDIVQLIYIDRTISATDYQYALALMSDNTFRITKDGGNNWIRKQLSKETYNFNIPFKFVNQCGDYVLFITESSEMNAEVSITSIAGSSGTLAASKAKLFNMTMSGGKPFSYKIIKLYECRNSGSSSKLEALSSILYIKDTDTTYIGTFTAVNTSFWGITIDDIESQAFIRFKGEINTANIDHITNIGHNAGSVSDLICPIWNPNTNNNDLYEISYESYGNHIYRLIDNTHDWKPGIRSNDGYMYNDSTGLIEEDPQLDKNIYISKSTEAPNSTDKELFANTYTKSDEIVYYEKELDEEINNENLRMLSYAQSLDVLYLAFPDGKTPPKELRRRSDVDWELVDFQPEDGPYNEINYDTSKTLKLSSHEDEEVTITSNFDLFSESDIGRHIRLNMAAYNKDTLAYEDHWTWGEITSFTNATTVKANMKVDNSKVKDNETTIDSNTTTWEWRLGAWTKKTGYPTKVTIHEQRLAWSGITDRPWVWLSNSFAHRFYAPSEYDGTITDSNAITHDLSTDKISRVQWMKSVKNLIIGTEFEELRMMSSGPALAPSDVAVLREASYGSYSAEPVITEDVIIFIQRLQRSLRALSYDYYRDAFLGPNLALLSEDLTLGGIKKIVYQKEPYSVLWLLKEDGKLLTCTYDKEQEVVGWTECELAGDARVVDLIVFPSGNIKQDSVAFIVERTINGKTRRYLELLTREYLSNVELKDITFMDSSIRYQGTPTNKIAGLDHLEGETVTVVENGAIVGSYPVKNDVVTDDAGEIIATEYYIDLDTEVSDAWIGLPYDAYFKTLERDFGDKQLSTHNSKIRIYKLYFTLLNTLGMTVQQLNDGEEFNLIVFDPHEDISTQPEPISGREELDVMSTWTNDIMHYSMKVNAIPCLPCTVAGITTGIEINAL
jgi:hypothetical protein